MLASLLTTTAALPAVGAAQSLCDATGDGEITIADAIDVLRASAQLPSSCTVATCDTNRDGMISVDDGVSVLRSVASLGSACDGNTTPTPTVSRTPGGPLPTAASACDADCQTSLDVCGDELFFDEFDSVQECTDDCVEIVEDFALDASDFDACVDGQVRFIQCCTHRRQCGEIPDGCDAEFNDAANACGGEFGGCPLIFF